MNTTSTVYLDSIDSTPYMKDKILALSFIHDAFPHSLDLTIWLAFRYQKNIPFSA